MTDFMNLKIKLIQSFRCTHKDKVCMRVFIGVNAHTCMSICIYTVFLKKTLGRRGEDLKDDGRVRIGVVPASGGLTGLASHHATAAEGHYGARHRTTCLTCVYYYHIYIFPILFPMI
jgi:hypothetical protein